LTTVGYGDLVPTTDVARLFTAIYILVGVVTVFASSGIIGTELIKTREQKLIKKKEKK